ncbi:MAG TPA: hypothetical protein VM684_01745, partial [Gaiellales bacterium]|nr:hypothetical protein [Gaiellales bacterium]
DPEVSERARHHLQAWLQRFDRSFTKPSPDQLQSIRTAIRDAGDRLAPDLSRKVTFLLEKGF